MAFTRVKTWSDDEAFTATSQEANFKKLRSEINRGLAEGDIYINASPRGTTSRYIGPRELKKLEVSKTGPGQADLMAVGCSGTTAAVCNDLAVQNGYRWVTGGTNPHLESKLAVTYNGAFTNIDHPRLAVKSSGTTTDYLSGDNVQCVPKTGISFYLEKTADVLIEFWYQPDFLPDAVFDSGDTDDSQSGGLTSYIDAFAMYRPDADESWTIEPNMGIRFRSPSNQPSYAQGCAFHMVKTSLAAGWHHLCLGAVSDYQLVITGTTGVIVETVQAD